jgi:predicted protein tyrosine phosphatase
MSSAPCRKKVLFVCRENRIRSLTAEAVYSGRPDLEVRSAGIAEYAAVPLTAELIEWADLVFVFSKAQQRIVEARFGERSGRKPLRCLRLSDRFDYKSPKLVSKLTRKLGPYLGAPANNSWASAANSPVKPIAEYPAVAPDPDAASPLRHLSGLFNSMLSETKALLAEPST